MEFYKIKRQLCYQKYSQSTIDTYLSCLQQFNSYLESKKLDIDEDIIKDYLQILSLKKYSRSTINQHINAIKFYLEKVLGHSKKKYCFQRPRKDRKLPIVLSADEVQRIFHNLSNVKHKAIITLMYSSGLRIGEVINLKIEDIDSERMFIHIKEGKGSKDRMVPLATNVLVLLREYYKIYKPKQYLFNGVENHQYSVTSIRRVL